MNITTRDWFGACLRLFAAALFWGLMGGPVQAHPDQARSPRHVKVLIISMFGPEGQGWVDRYKLTDHIKVDGLSADYPEVHCNADDVCQVTTGMGHSNVAASITALVFSQRFDLSQAYFLIAGIAGIDPSQGTLGSATWARYLIDYGIAWEIDARDAPATWPSGYLGINTKSPTEKPPLDYRTEVFQLDEALLQKALALSSKAVLEDSDTAIAYRAHWPTAPANQPPKVVQCDTAGGDTWWHGAILEKRAQDWTRLLTDGQGVYCTTQQEDNATYEALKRGATAGLLDLKRVAVLRTASNFDRPYPGQTAYDSLVNSISGGFLPAIHNLVNAGGPLVNDIVKSWPRWKFGLGHQGPDHHSRIWAPRLKLPVKVLVISMFGPEAQPWIDAYKLKLDIKVPGLSPDYPAVHCNLRGLCNLTTGMGHANAAASVTALLHSGQFDLSQTYVLIAGIAGIDPSQGTVGSAAWARWAVDFGISWELDPREMPAGWETGYFGINTKGPGEKPPLDYRTEVFHLNDALVDKAYALSKNAVLQDSAEAAAFRAKFPAAPANQPPAVIQCDTMAGDTWYAGTRLSNHARAWTKLLTDGAGTYCTTQQEDNATIEALKRADAAGLADLQRVAVLRTGSDFDRPYPGQADVDGLLNYQVQGGFVPATQNLVLAGRPLVDAILDNWRQWKRGVPAP
jgi:purine nucleoside permease